MTAVVLTHQNDLYDTELIWDIVSELLMVFLRGIITVKLQVQGKYYIYGV